MQLAIEERVDTLEIVLVEFIVSTNKMGTIVEDMVAPNVPGITRDLFEIRNVQ